MASVAPMHNFGHRTREGCQNGCLFIALSCGHENHVTRPGPGGCSHLSLNLSYFLSTSTIKDIKENFPRRRQCLASTQINNNHLCSQPWQSPLIGGVGQTRLPCAAYRDAERLANVSWKHVHLVKMYMLTIH